MSVVMRKVGTRVIVKSGGHDGARDYVGQEGVVIAVNQKFAHAVQFANGDYWFYFAEDLKLPTT